MRNSTPCWYYDLAYVQFFDSDKNTGILGLLYSQEHLANNIHVSHHPKLLLQQVYLFLLPHFLLVSIQRKVLP